MPPKQIIYSTNLQEFRPIIWYGEPIFTKYNQLKSILSEKLGDKYADFLAEPVISKEMISGKGKAHWMSDFVTKGTPFSKLNTQQQEQARQILQLYINKIKIFAKELQNDENQDLSELGELLLLAVEVPGLDYIFVEDNKICLVLWGFSSEESKKVNFQISKVIEPPVGYIPPKDIHEQVENKEVDDKINIEKQLDENKIPEEKQIQKNNVENTENQTPPPPPVENKKTKKKGMPGWLWFLLGMILMFLILFLLWWFLLRNVHQILPDESGVLPPIDTTQVDIDPDDPGERPIFTNKVNVALIKGANIETFATTLAEKYENQLEVVYYDTTINLLQIQTPEGEWKKWRDSLKTFSEVRLTFNESLFQEGKIPNDPGFSQSDQNWYFDVIGVYNAWEISQGDENVVVAIIDDGFDISHPEFKDKIVNPWNVVTRSDNLFPSGGSEHGTHVAATAVGWNDNALGVCGIAPNCKLMPIQIGDADGLMSSLSIVAGILYAIHHEADVVNMSLGMYFGDDVYFMSEQEQKQLISSLYPEEAEFWDELYSFANETDIILVQAAGNQDILAGLDPFCRSDRNIIVSATDVGNVKADFSNYGDFSLISAPGVGIYSAIPGEGFEFLDGTSMASPIVTGAVALMKSVHKDWTPEEIITALINSAKPLNSDKYIGPLLQLDKALNYDPNDTILIIPDNPEDLAFAEGLWESNNSLVSTIDQQPVKLYFEIREDGTGELTLVESNGTKCKADLDVSIEDGKLIMLQKENADCDDDIKYYYPYLFECTQGEDNKADCKCKQTDGTGDFLDFELYKKN